MAHTVKIMPGAEPIFKEGGSVGVLMLHGFTGTPYEFREMAALLAGRGVTVSVPLLDGHGTRSRELNKCRWRDWYNTAKNRLFELRKKCSTVFVIGQSMGGTLALHLAAHYQVKGLVLLAPAYKIKHPLAFLAPWVAGLWKFKHKRNGGPDIQNLKSRKECVCYPTIPLRAFNELMKMINHVKDDFQDVHVPVLLAHAREDHTIRYSGSKELYDQLPSRNKIFLELKNSYHVLTLDNDKEIVFRETINFILNKIKKTSG